jgi:hypothetical protein
MGLFDKPPKRQEDWIAAGFLFVGLVGSRVETQQAGWAAITNYSLLVSIIWFGSIFLRRRKAKAKASLPPDVPPPPPV